MRKYILLLLVIITIAGYTFAQPKNVIEAIEISNVVSAFPVRYAMKTYKGCQYIGYYDSDHNMVIAKRKPDSKQWQKTIMPTKIGWDSHNYVTFAFDSEGYMHISGNMHAVPLIYFRSTKPESIDEFETIKSMTGIDELRTTYPSFMKNGKGELIFHYRSGGSGNGFEVYNIYDTETKKWSRLLDKPLIDGLGQRNAYMQGPTLGKDGYYHLIWVWRDTPDCSTNHTLSYARSKDLINWENIRGEKTVLPITFDKSEFVIDGTAPKGGLFNPGIKLSFDSKNRPLVGYHKYDNDGNNQLYVARFENDKWKTVKLTDWKYRWQFEGNGSMKTELTISNPTIVDKNTMAFGFYHSQYGTALVLFDQNTLEPKGTRDAPLQYPREYDNVWSDTPGMIVNKIFDGQYLLRWETLPSNRDKKPEGELPPPSKLMLYRFK